MRLPDHSLVFSHRSTLDVLLYLIITLNLEVDTMITFIL